MGQKVKKPSDGLSWGQLSQGSSCLSHGPSSRVSKHEFSAVKTVSTTTRFRTRYVYSARCNPSSVEILLKMSKDNLLKLSEGRVNDKQAVSVKKCDYTDKTAKACINKGVYHRSYAEVVRVSCQKTSYRVVI